MYEQSLTQAGLTSDMAQIYELLLKNGAQSAGKLAKKSGLKRGLTYKTLERLLEKQLIEKSEENEKVAVFTATHPLKLQDMIESRQQRAKNAQLALDGVLGVLISDYNLGLGKPGLNVYEGVSGLSRIYDDVINFGHDFLLFRSSYDNDDPELGKLVAKQIKRQVDRQIHIRTLTPLIAETPKSVIEMDEANLVTRRIIPKELFILDSQIIVYGNKVAITSLKKKIISTVIDNPDIASTFKTIFEYIWQKSTPEHEKYWDKIWNRQTKNTAS